MKHLKHLLVALAILVPVSSPGAASAQDLLGAGSMSAGASFLFGERLGGGGGGFTAHFEVA